MLTLLEKAVVLERRRAGTAGVPGSRTAQPRPALPPLRLPAAGSGAVPTTANRGDDREHDADLR